MKHRITLVVLICAMAMSCRFSNKETISLDSMKVVMWDMMKMDELYTRMALKDTTLKNKKENIRLYEEVFALHHITKKQFEDAYKFYESHPVQFKILLDSIDVFANREHNKGVAPI